MPTASPCGASEAQLMAKPRIFTTLPSAVIADTSLTALDIRCLAVIAMHDGMSGVKGAGGGCFARNATLAALVNTDVTNFSKCLTKLIKAKYVSREPQIMDKRRFTLRVLYPTDDSWRTDQQPNPLMVGELANNPSEVVGEDANQPPEIVGDGESENGSFSKVIGRDYISLNEEIDFVKTNEINSDKRRIVADARDPVGIICRLPKNFPDLPVGAQVAKVEAAFNAINRDADAIPESEVTLLSKWLFETFDGFIDEPFGQQAQRLYEEILP